MAETNIVLSNFEFGEIAPDTQARNDLKIGAFGLSRCENFLVTPQGGVRFRNGFRHVFHTRRMKQAVFIPFQFNDLQSYLIEATDQFFRFYKDDAIITEATKTITDVIVGATTTVTSAAHGYSNGDEVFIDGLVGPTRLNGRSYLVASVATNTFQLQDLFGNAFNSTGFGAYSSGGTSAKIYELATPYLEADLANLQFAQNADTMYIVNENYEPRKLTRSGHTAWALATFTRTADPFTSPNWPRAVTFTNDGRLIYFYRPNNTESFWGSMAPNASGPRYDNFTGGTAATDAFSFTLAPVKGKVDSIQWVANTDKFLVVGTFGSIRRIYGASEAEPVNATNITAKTAASSEGCARVLPVSLGTTVFYIRRGGQGISSFEYDYRIDGYVSVNRNLISGHLLESGLKQIVFQNSSPSVLWAVRNDGGLIGLTYEDKEDKAGWHRQVLGGDAKVLWAGIMPRPTKREQLWVVTERTIDGRAVRAVELMEDQERFPERLDFYTNDEVADNKSYENALYEQQKQSVHLDASLKLDGSVLGLNANATLTFSALTGTGVTVTANNAVFAAAHVGRQIWGKHSPKGVGGGRAVITGYTSPTSVTVTILNNFVSLTHLPGAWYLTFTTLAGLYHLNNTTVKVIADGAEHPDKLVTNDAITLDYPASVAIVGLGYRGFVNGLNLEFGPTVGPSVTRIRNFNEIRVRVLHSAGIEMGESPYSARRVEFRQSKDLMDRPVPLATGIYKATHDTRWERLKQFCILQNAGLPCHILAVDAQGDSSDE